MAPVVQEAAAEEEALFAVRIPVILPEAAAVPAVAPLSLSQIKISSLMFLVLFMPMALMVAPAEKAAKITIQQIVVLISVVIAPNKPFQLREAGVAEPAVAPEGVSC